MKIEDYNKYYIQDSDHYLIPKDVFKELFNEMINWKEESQRQKEVKDKFMKNGVFSLEYDKETLKDLVLELQEENEELKKQLEERTKMYQNAYNYSQKMESKVIILEAQQKEFRKYLEDYQDGASRSLDPYDCGINDCLGDALSKYKEITQTNIWSTE